MPDLPVQVCKILPAWGSLLQPRLRLSHRHPPQRCAETKPKVVFLSPPCPQFADITFVTLQVLGTIPGLGQCHVVFLWFTSFSKKDCTCFKVFDFDARFACHSLQDFACLGRFVAAQAAPISQAYPAKGCRNTTQSCFFILPMPPIC